VTKVPASRAPALPPPPPLPAEGAAYLAAVDLGSNSFHMVIAREVAGVPAVVDRIREPVQLALGLDEKGRLDADAQERAIACLKRFGQRIRHVPRDRVRAIGTNTLRLAKRAHRFLARAEAALGHPIEVVSGAEEARLIYLGVAHDVSDDTGRRLVVDIGGGSTEVVLGERFEVQEAHSLYVGCVGFTRRYFPGGEIRRAGFDEAILAARTEVQTIERGFRALGWERALGASGTIRSTWDVLRENGWGNRGITPEGLRRLRKALLAAGHVRDVRIAGLTPDRAPVYPGGLAILIALFDGLGIERLEASEGALREGTLYDLLGRIRHEDVRERTIRIFQERYQVDRGQAARVEKTALALLAETAPGWGLDPEQVGRFLVWAARLHEIGLALSYGHHHHHGAYLVQGSDMPGFSRDDQNLLAAVIGGHRRHARRRDLRTLHGPRRRLAVRLSLLLRVAVLLHRERVARPLPPLHLTGRPRSLRVRFPAGWLDAHPLTRIDLEREAAHAERLGIRLDVGSAS